MRLLYRQDGCSRASTLAGQCNVSASVALNATAGIPHAYGVAAGDICGFQK